MSCLWRRFSTYQPQHKPIGFFSLTLFRISWFGCKILVEESIHFPAQPEPVMAQGHGDQGAGQIRPHGMSVLFCMPKSPLGLQELRAFCAIELQSAPEPDTILIEDVDTQNLRIRLSVLSDTVQQLDQCGAVFIANSYARRLQQQNFVSPHRFIPRNSIFALAQTLVHVPAGPKQQVDIRLINVPKKPCAFIGLYLTRYRLFN